MRMVLARVSWLFMAIAITAWLIGTMTVIPARY